MKSTYLETFYLLGFIEKPFDFLVEILKKITKMINSTFTIKNSGLNLKKYDHFRNL